MESYNGVAKAIANVVKENYPMFKMMDARVVNDKLAIVIERV